MQERVVNIIALVITAVWATSFICDILMSTYEPSPYLHVIMMSVAGAAFGSSLVKKKGNDDD